MVNPEATYTSLHQSALLLHQQGALESADRLYEQILAANAENVPVLHLSALVNYQLNRWCVAVDKIETAIRLSPETALYHYDYAVMLHEHGDLQNALTQYQLALVGSGLPSNNMAPLISALVELDQLDDVIEALARYKQSIVHSNEWLHQIVHYLLKNNRILEAKSLLNFLYDCSPDSATYAYLQALVSKYEGNFLAAISAFRTALEHEPYNLDVKNELAVSLQFMDEWEQARALYQDILKQDPNHIDAHLNLGGCFQKTANFTRAIAHFQRAIALDPGNAIAYENLAIIRRQQGYYADSERYYGYSLAILSNQAAREKYWGVKLRRHLELPAIYQTTQEIDQVRRQLTNVISQLESENIHLADPLRSVGITCFFLAYHGFPDTLLQKRIADLYGNEITELPVGYQRQGGKKLKIGFVSANLSNHTIGKLNLGYIKQLNRSDFSIAVFSVGSHKDRTANAIRQAVEEYHVLPNNLEIIKRTILESGLDILLFTDIGMEPVTYFLAFNRLAPIQCVTWGHPITTGIRNIDYFISNNGSEINQADQYYTESLVKFDTMQPYYYEPKISGSEKSRAALGLPDDKTLYICPQSLFKFHPSFDSLLKRILEQDEQGVLVLVHGQNQTWSHLLMSRFRQTMMHLMDRILIIPRSSGSDFLNWMKVADLMLDTTQFCGGNTTYEGLAMGTPIVTLPSKLARGRFSFAIYQKMEFLHCVADSESEFIDIAVRLGKEKDYNQWVRGEIKQRSPFLFNDQKTVIELEQWFKEVSE